MTLEHFLGLTHHHVTAHMLIKTYTNDYMIAELRIGANVPRSFCPMRGTWDLGTRLHRLLSDDELLQYQATYMYLCIQMKPLSSLASLALLRVTICSQVCTNIRTITCYGIITDARNIMSM